MVAFFIRIWLHAKNGERKQLISYTGQCLWNQEVSKHQKDIKSSYEKQKYTHTKNTQI